MKTYKQFIKEIFALIVEDRVDDAIANNPDIHPDVIKHYANHVDPSEKKSYLPWIIDQHKQGKVSTENSDELKDALHKFHANLGGKNSVIPGNQKNINNHSYESLVGLGKTLPDTNTDKKTKLDYIKDEYRGKLGTEHDAFAEHKDSDAIVDHFAKHADPSAGKDHLRWLLDQYRDKKIKQEDAHGIHGTLSDFDKHKHLLEKPDLRDYKSIGDVREAMDREGVIGSKAGSRDEHIINKGRKLIHDFKGTGVKVYHTHTKEASQAAYGGVTDWCTAARSGRNKYKDYTEKAPLHQIHVEGDTQSPYQLSGVAGKDELRDKNNKPTKTPEEFAREHPELKGSVLGNEHPAFATEEQMKQFEPKLLKKIKSGDHTDKDLETAKKYGYYNQEHKDALANQLTDKFNKGKLLTDNDNHLYHAKKYGYYNQEHKDALANHLINKINNDKHTDKDLEHAKKYDYYNQDIKNALAKHLTNRINNGTKDISLIGHLYHAKEYEYYNQEHKDALAKRLTNNIKSDNFEDGLSRKHNLSMAKEFGYYTPEHEELLKNQGAN